MKRIVTLVLIIGMLAPSPLLAQVLGDVWRSFAARVEVGTELNVRLHNGQRFRAVLVGVRDDAVLLQPKTRIPVPVQDVSYDAIASLERRQEGGIGAGKAAAIGVGAGVGTFFGLLLILFATIAD